MPFDQQDDAQPGPIDWDEFHPTSPYDTYVPRTPPRRKWSLLLGIVLFFTAQYGVALILPPLLIQAGVISSDASRLASGGFTALVFWTLIVANVVTAVLFVTTVLGYYREPLSSLGLTTEKVPRALLFGVAGFVVAFVAATVVSIPIEQLVGVDPTQQALSQAATVEPGLLPLILLSAVIVAPIVEEIVFRGYLYKAFRDRFKPGYAILLSSALFSIIHLEWRAAIPLFVIGIVLAYVYEKTGNLIAPITVHMLNNAIAFLWTT